MQLLLVPNAEAVAAAPAPGETLAREAAEPRRRPTRQGIPQQQRRAKPHALFRASLRKLTSLKARANAEVAAADKALAAAKIDEAKARAEERRQKAVTRAAEAGKQFDTATAMRSRSPMPRLQRRPSRRPRPGNRLRQGGARCEARGRAGLDLHQPRHAEALRAA